MLSEVKYFACIESFSPLGGDTSSSYLKSKQDIDKST